MNENPPSDGPRFLPQGIEVQLHHSRPRQLLGGRLRRPQAEQGTNLYIFGTLMAALEKAVQANDPEARRCWRLLLLAIERVERLLAAARERLETLLATATMVKLEPRRGPGAKTYLYSYNTAPAKRLLLLLHDYDRLLCRAWPYQQAQILSRFHYHYYNSLDELLLHLLWLPFRLEVPALLGLQAPGQRQ